MAQTPLRRRRFLLLAVALSVAVHLVAALVIVLLPRILPHDSEPKDPATVELLMVEKTGGQPRNPGQPSDNKPTPQQQQQETPKPETPKPEAPKPETPKPETRKPETRKPETRKPETPKAETPKPEAPKAEVQKDEPPAPQANPAPPTPENGDEPAPAPTEQSPPNPAREDPQPPSKQVESQPHSAALNPAKDEPQPPAKQVEAQPTPAPTPQAPVFDLAGTESDSNAIAMGTHVLPAAPDNRFRNRPPEYPVVVQRRGEHGSVTVMIHVAENGTASSVDIVASSGVDLLDQAAVAAVRKWRFHPAMKAGQAVPFDYPFEFIFEPRE